MNRLYYVTQPLKQHTNENYMEKQARAHTHTRAKRLIKNYFKKLRNVYRPLRLRTLIYYLGNKEQKLEPEKESQGCQMLQSRDVIQDETCLMQRDLSVGCV